MILGQRLGRVEEERGPSVFGEGARQRRKGEYQRLPRSRRRYDENVFAGEHGIERFHLMREQSLDAGRGQRFRKLRRQWRGKLGVVRRAALDAAMVHDLGAEELVLQEAA